MPTRRKLPSYGVDAPGVVAGFFAGAIALAVIIVAILKLASWPLSLITIPFSLATGVLLMLGTSMLVYSSVGKYRLRDHLLRQREWRGDEFILDIGAGRGLMAIGAARCAPRGKVVALDIWSSKDPSGNTPQRLQDNAVIEKVEKRIEIVTGDARHIAIPDASVDVVVSVFCIHNIEPEDDRRRVCREIARVLKPGGTALIADFPTVAPYVVHLREAGLTVDKTRRGEPIALGIAGYLVARRAAAAAA